MQQRTSRMEPVPENPGQGRSTPMRRSSSKVDLDSSISWRNEPQVCGIVLSSVLLFLRANRSVCIAILTLLPCSTAQSYLSAPSL